MKLLKDVIQREPDNADYRYMWELYNGLKYLETGARVLARRRFEAAAAIAPEGSHRASHELAKLDAAEHRIRAASSSFFARGRTKL